jgi:hypothetical protein
VEYEEERKKAISYCGTCCLKCDWHSGRIKMAADELLDMIKNRPELRMWCKGEEHYDVGNFLKVLEYLSRTGFCRFTCKQGSGYGGCPVRQCCERKGLAFCYQCNEFPCEIWGKWPFGKEKIENLKEMKETGAEAWVEKLWKEALRL